MKIRANTIANYVLLAFILAIGIYDIWQNLIPVQYQAMDPEYVKDFTAEHAVAFITALRATFSMAASIGAIGVILSWLRGTGLKKTRRGE